MITLIPSSLSPLTEYLTNIYPAAGQLSLTENNFTIDCLRHVLFTVAALL